MAIAYDTSVDGGLANPATSLSWSHTTSGSNRLLVVGLFGDTSDAITGVTYNSVAMTLVNKIASTGSGRYAYLYYLMNPASGSNSIVASASGSIAIYGMSASYTGVHQSSALNANNTGIEEFSAAFQTVSVVPAADNTWSVMVTRGEFVGAITGGSGTTIRRSTASGLVLSDSNGPITPAGSNSLTVNTASPSTKWASVIGSFAPDTGGGGGSIAHILAGYQQMLRANQ